MAYRALSRREQGEDFIENLLENELSRSNVAAIDRGLCTELAFGVVRRQRTLDWLIARKAKSAEPKPGLKVLLRLGLYQMFWLGRIPDHAAVHETVELGKRVGFVSQAGFLNAILRAYTREKGETEHLLKTLEATDPGIAFSHPDWLVQRWRSRLGNEKAGALLEWNNLAPYTFARVNFIKTDAEKLTKQWQSEGVKFTAKTYPWTDDGLVFQLDSHPPLADLPSFRQGLFYVQDPSTLLSVHELAPRPNDSVLDLCSAPGGKTTFAAQLMQNRGSILAQDIEPNRLKLVQENCVRLGVVCVHYATAVENAEVTTSRQFDRILIDAPCSNTGVLRRRVDLRWRIRPEEIGRLRATQLKLLEQAAPRLKSGGVLVYSTCSVEPEENREVVNAFLAEHTGFTLERDHEVVPFAQNVDGAYVARLRLNR